MLSIPPFLIAPEANAGRPLTNLEMALKPLADWVGVEPMALIATVVIVTYAYLALTAIRWCWARWSRVRV